MMFLFISFEGPPHCFFPSSLGELFDHGCDSWSTILVPLGLISGIGRGSEWGGSPHDALFPCLATVAGFYLCHWEKLITGCLEIPWIYDIMQLVSEPVVVSGHTFHRVKRQTLGTP